MALPYFKFFPEDWLSSSSVDAMTYEQKGVYQTILAKMWARGEKDGRVGLPADDKWLANTLHISLSKWKALRAVLLDGPDAVLHILGGVLVNDRLTKEWESAKTKSQKASESVGQREDRKSNIERSTDEDRTYIDRTTDDDRTTNHARSRKIPDPRSQTLDSPAQTQASPSSATPGVAADHGHDLDGPTTQGQSQEEPAAPEQVGDIPYWQATITKPEDSNVRAFCEVMGLDTREAVREAKAFGRVRQLEGLYGRGFVAEALLTLDLKHTRDPFATPADALAYLTATLKGERDRANAPPSRASPPPEHERPMTLADHAILNGKVPHHGDKPRVPRPEAIQDTPAG